MRPTFFSNCLNFFASPTRRARSMMDIGATVARHLACAGAAQLSDPCRGWAACWAPWRGAAHLGTMRPVLYGTPSRRGHGGARGAAGQHICGARPTATTLGDARLLRLG